MDSDPARGPSDRSAETIADRLALTATDGHEASGYLARPRARPLAGLVVLQEIFGLNRHIREVCDGYARQGYAALAPALFDRVRQGVELGYDEDGVRTGRELRAKIGWDAALADVQAAIDALRVYRTIAVLGFCWGGTLAFLAATRLAHLSCAVSYYGGQTVPFAAERVRIPLLMHFGEEDPRIPPSNRETILRHNPDIEVHVFPADHGFNCDHRKEWHEPSAIRARELTLDFLARNLAGRAAHLQTSETSQ